MFISKDICPVPFDQQPLNEYISLKNSCFFSWSILPFNEYLQTICYIFGSLFIVFIPIVLAVMPRYTTIFPFILVDLLVITFILIFVFVRLYLGWSYVIKRLVSATVFYEESGWYDGQIWVKTVDSMTKDRLIGLYEVTPYIDRIKYSLFVIIMLFLVEGICYYLI
uniref:Photosystem I assembly protein Ycf36 n=1 Tax=Riquetophycus sp. TaxID=1897556 RepID=A0A1C9C7Z3_9FLOR|nr:hypothetical protein Riqu_017 [Riquetophycus sp.]